MMMWWTMMLAHAGPAGTAEIPVQELLELHRADAPEPPPPVAGALDRLALTGRVLDDAVDLKVATTVSVLASDEWTAVPLLDVGPGVSLHDVPTLTGAWLVVQDETLTLLAKKPGTHTFTFGATVNPTVRGRRRDMQIRVHPATSSRMDIEHDPGLVQIVAKERTAGGYRLAWQQVGEPVRQEVVAPTVAEPTVRQATSTVVSTLEGTWLVRTHYALSFQGRRELVLSVPAGHAVERVFVNGRPTEASPVAGQLVLEVAPERAGGDEGSVELVLSGDRGGYLLQGTLDVALPGISWPVTAWECATHLPEVFDYAWQGGSMQQREGDLAQVAVSYSMPTPGAARQWRQELVFEAAPSLRLGYTVNLEGAYFRPKSLLEAR